MTKRSQHIRLLVSAAVLISSTVIWGVGLKQSPLFQPEIQKEFLYVKRYKMEHTPDRLAEKILAEAYWLRYPDIRSDGYFGEKGPIGIYGAREHYEQHGKREGRLYAPISIPGDLVREQLLAEAYWLRYPEIARSKVWGRKGTLGILGPRDFYYHYGRFRGHKWGLKGERHP